MNSEHVQETASPAGTDTRERWEISASSGLEFVLRHIVVLEIRGRFHRWGGVLLIDRDDPKRSRAEIWIELGSIDTESAERDAHVRSAEFLDVARFPRARFVSTAVELDDERILLRGDLDLHGVVQELEIEVLPGPVSQDGRGIYHARYLARGVINRQSFGLHWNQDLDVGGVVVGDRIELRADVDAVRMPAGARGGSA